MPRKRISLCLRYTPQATRRQANLLYEHLVADHPDVNRRIDEATEIRKSIKAFDKWFQYAETIGQTRLYNFLMAFSIQLAACSVLLQLQKFAATLLSMAVAIGGFIVCLRSITLGKRQIKFHRLIEGQICELMEKYIRLPDPKVDIRYLPVYRVLHLKRLGYDELFFGEKLCDAEVKPIQLSDTEHKYSARYFLVLVPWVFIVLFSITLAISALLACEQGLASKRVPKFLQDPRPLLYWITHKS